MSISVAMRTDVLRRHPGYFRDFFSDAANVNKKNCANQYEIDRPFKHFGAIMDYLRDGTCEFPCGYTPSTYDNRTATTDEQELIEFLREAHYCRIETLVEETILYLVAIWKQNGSDRLRRQVREQIH